MPHEAKVNFTRGEYSPLAHARRDIESYQAAAELLKNWVVLREGGVRRRSGTRYLGKTKYTDRDTRLVDFVYSLTQSYVIEMGDAYVRFWTHLGQVMSGDNPYEVVSPYDVDDIRALTWVRSEDVLYIARRSMTQKPQKLKRIASNDWAFEDVVFRDGPYLPINDVNNKATPGTTPATSGTSVITFDNTNNVNGGTGFVSTDVGRQFRLQVGGSWSWGHITTVTDDKTVTVTWDDGQGGGTTASLSWRLGAFSDTTGYPGAVELFQGRVFWGNTPTNPRFIGYSMSGLPDTFSPSDTDGTVTDSHGGAIEIINGDEILWMVESTALQLGTPRAVRSLAASDIQQQLSPRNIKQSLEIKEGVSDVRPVIVGPSTIHASRFSRALNDLYYDYQVNSLVRPEFSTTAEHLFFNTVIEVVYQQSPWRRLWSVLSNGELACTTVDRYEKVIGFTSHDVSGDVISACSIPGTVQDDLYLVVRRTINGQEVQYIESLEPDFFRDELKDAWFSDCGGIYQGAATNRVTGITWLRNTVVSALADGKVLPNATVDGTGALTLPNNRTATQIIFGIPIEARGRVLRAPTQTPSGSSLGRKMRVIGVEVDLFETKGLTIESDTGQSDRLLDRPASRQRTAAETFTGTFRLGGDGSWSSEGQFDFVMNTPLPATVRALNINLDVEE